MSTKTTQHILLLVCKGCSLDISSSPSLSSFFLYKLSSLTFFFAFSNKTSNFIYLILTSSWITPTVVAVLNNTKSLSKTLKVPHYSLIFSSYLEFTCLRNFSWVEAINIDAFAHLVSIFWLRF